MNNRSTESLLVSLSEWRDSHYFGKYRGIVRDNEDPRNLGRIKAEVPEIYGAENESPWALPNLPYAGDGSGLYTIPEPGTGVWIEFEAGNISRPIWTGCWWGNDQLPVDHEGTNATPDLKIIRTEQGLMVTMNDANQSITLSDENGQNIMTIKVQEGLIKIQGNIKVVVEAPQIELVENATHPVVFGDELMSYLNQLVQLYNTHMHPGELALGVFPVTPAPPVPPFIPPTPALISTKVKSG